MFQSIHKGPTSRNEITTRWWNVIYSTGNRHLSIPVEHEHDSFKWVVASVLWCSTCGTLDVDTCTPRDKITPSFSNAARWDGENDHVRRSYAFACTILNFNYRRFKFPPPCYSTDDCDVRITHRVMLAFRVTKRVRSSFGIHGRIFFSTARKFDIVTGNEESIETNPHACNIIYCRIYNIKRYRDTMYIIRL